MSVIIWGTGDNVELESGGPPLRAFCVSAAKRATRPDWDTDPAHNSCSRREDKFPTEDVKTSACLARPTRRLESTCGPDEPNTRKQGTKYHDDRV